MVRSGDVHTTHNRRAMNEKQKCNFRNIELAASDQSSFLSFYHHKVREEEGKTKILLRFEMTTWSAWTDFFVFISLSSVEMLKWLIRTVAGIIITPAE